MNNLAVRNACRYIFRSQKGHLSNTIKYLSVGSGALTLTNSTINSTGLSNYHGAMKRDFSCGTICYKKQTKSSKGNKKSKGTEDEEEVIEFDFGKLLKDTEANFKESLKVHKEKSAEAKLGKANTSIFDNLEVHLSHGQAAKFTDIAHTTLKGRSLLITVFDPKDTKNVVSAVIGANLNLNPQVDPKNPQLLKVPLPSPTAEVKNETAKQLKVVFETFKSSSSKYSLSSVRGDAMKELKSLKKSDDLKKTMAQVEQLYKQYLKQLSDNYKDLEKAVFQ